MSGSITSSKIVTYAALAPEGASASKLVTYAVLAPPIISASKVVTYAVLFPLPPIPLAATLTISLSVAANSSDSIPMGATPTLHLSVATTSTYAMTLSASGNLSVTTFALLGTPVQYPYPTPPTWTQQQYATAFLRLLPQGLAWPTYGQSQLAQSLYPLSGVYARNNALAAELLIDAFPATTVQLSTEWLLALGLPGPCIVGYPEISAAQQGIVTQLTDKGGCSVDYFVGIAKNLGFDVTLEQYMPLRVGMAVGSPVLPDSAAFVVNMIISSGSPASLLYCEIERRIPVHIMLYVTDIDGTVLSPPPTLYPAVSVAINAGVATFTVPTPQMQISAVNYSGGSYSGTVVFQPGQLSHTVTMDDTVTSVTLSDPLNLSLG